MFWLQIFLPKVAQMYGDFYGFIKYIKFDVKTALATFSAAFGKIGLLFIPPSGLNDGMCGLVDNTLSPYMRYIQI